MLHIDDLIHYGTTKTPTVQCCTKTIIYLNPYPTTDGSRYAQERVEEQPLGKNASTSKGAASDSEFPVKTAVAPPTGSGVASLTRRPPPGGPRTPPEVNTKRPLPMRGS